MPTRRLLLPLAALALAAALPARAQPLDPSPAGSIDADPAADQLIWSPTGQTHRAGDVFVNVYNFWGIETGYAPTDRLQVSLAGAYLLEDGLGVWGARLKWQALGGEHAHLSLFGGASYAAEVRISGEPSAAVVLSGGLAADACAFDCRLTFAASVEHFQSVGQWGPTLHSYPLPSTRGTVGAALAVSSSIKLLVQGEQLLGWAAHTPENAPRSGSSLLVWPTAGVRWFHSRWAVDVAAGYSAAAAGNLALLVGGTVRL